MTIPGVRKSSITEIPIPESAQVSITQIPVGLYSPHETVSISAWDRSWLLEGRGPHGKSAGTALIVEMLSRLDGVALIDLSADDATTQPWRSRFSATARNPEHTLRLLRAVRAQIDGRMWKVKTHGLVKAPADNAFMPQIVLIIDDLDDVVGMGQDWEIRRQLVDILRNGHLAAVSVVASSRHLGLLGSMRSSFHHEMRFRRTGICSISDYQDVQLFWPPTESLPDRSHLRPQLDWLEP